MRELTVHLLGHRAFLDHDDDALVEIGHRRDEEIDQFLRPEPRDAEIDAIFGDRGIVLCITCSTSASSTEPNGSRLVKRLLQQESTG